MHFYPRSPRGERHALHAQDRGLQADFYPRSPRGERPRRGPLSGREKWRFLSTLPARGATINCKRDHLARLISIHAPREGSDRRWQWTPGRQTPFLSTLPARGATHRGAGQIAKALFLSTLPARGATSTAGLSGWSSTNFYPRSPRGERRSAEQRLQ